jgi:hypothetical protein
MAVRRVVEIEDGFSVASLDREAHWLPCTRDSDTIAFSYRKALSLLVKRFLIQPCLSFRSCATLARHSPQVRSSSSEQNRLSQGLQEEDTVLISMHLRSLGCKLASSRKKPIAMLRGWDHVPCRLRSPAFLCPSYSSVRTLTRQEGTHAGRNKAAGKEDFAPCPPRSGGWPSRGALRDHSFLISSLQRRPGLRTEREGVFVS